MLYEKEPGEDHLVLVTRSQHTLYLYYVILAKFLRCWVLSLVNVGMKMYISFSYKSNLDFTLLLKAIYFRFPFCCLLKTHPKGLDPLQIFCILVCLIETLDLYNLVSKN